MQLDHEQMPETALAWHRAGRGAVLATVIETWGSAPRPVGGQLVISGDAELAGSVSGGCVEGAVVAEAIDALDDGKARVLEYGVSDDEAFAVGLACGGRIRVMVEPVGAAMPEDMLADLVDALHQPDFDFLRGHLLPVLLSPECVAQARRFKRDGRQGSLRR